MNFHIIYYPLYMLIMHVSHNSDRMPDSSHMPESGRKRRLWSEDVTPVVCSTPARRHDSGRTSQLWSHITALIVDRTTCLTYSFVKDFTWSS
jgi:hypothetical protein